MDIFYTFNVKLKYGNNYDGNVFYELSRNPDAIFILNEYPEQIKWDYLSTNSNAFNLLRTNLDKVDWEWLSSNKDAIGILEQYPDKINWEKLSQNPSALKLLEENPHKIHLTSLLYIEQPEYFKLFKKIFDEDKKYLPPYIWNYLSRHPLAIDILKENFDKINWKELSQNPSAIDILEKNLDKINWSGLCTNKNGIKLLEANPDKIDWVNIVFNPNAVHIIKNNIKKLNTGSINDCFIWNDLGRNENACEITDKILDKYPEFEDLLYGLTKNKSINAIPVIKKHIKNIISSNSTLLHNILQYSPYIGLLLVTYHYDKIKSYFYSRYGKELIEWIYNPKNMAKWGHLCWNLDMKI